MSYLEEQLLPLSGLQHLLFCERQCVLIHVEKAWAENQFTAEGRVMHERVDLQGCACEGRDLRVERALPLRSLRLGLSGKADVMEFHRNPDGSWTPFPVEYKRGKPKDIPCDEVQLCAQAICIEEMTGLPTPNGSLFYGETRHRHDVVIDSRLRTLTEDAARRFHALVDSGTTPKAIYERRKCESCSLIEKCAPRLGRLGSVADYMERMTNVGNASDVET